MQKLKLFIALSSVYTFSLAQKIGDPYPKSIELIQEGIKLYDDNKVEDALENYKRVNRADSNFYFALYESALCYNALKQYDKTIECCRLGLTLNSTEEKGFIDLMGTAHDEKGNTDSAAYYYDMGIKKYPTYYKFYFEKGVMYGRKEKDSLALQLLFYSSYLNAFHAGTHLQIATISARNANYTAAILAYQYFLLLENQGDRAINALQALEKICNNNFEFVKKPYSVSANGQNNFTELDEIVKSRAAQIASYKTKVKLPYTDIIKQCQIVAEKFEYNMEDKGFYNQFYGRIFYRAWKNDFFEASMYSIFSGVSEETKAMAAKNKKDIEKFSNFISSEIVEYRRSEKAIINGKEIAGKRYFYKNGALEAVGETEGENKTGKWIYFAPGHVKEGEGNYVANKLDGVWTFYDFHGTKTSELTYKNGLLQGPYSIYRSNGLLKEKGNYNEGKADGAIEIYRSNGALKEKSFYKNGTIDGEYTLYNVNNNLSAKAFYSQGKLTGKVINYHTNGAVSEEREFVNGDENGPTKQYFDTGELLYSGTYKNGKATGTWTWYFKNGKKQKEGSYKDGDYTGIWTEYYSNGKIKDIFNYNDEKELDGEYKMYLRSGALVSEGKYRNGKMQHSIFYDENKKIIEEIKNNQSEYTFKKYYYNGNLQEQGEVKKTKREGKFISYYMNGAKSEEYSYTDGKLNGLDISYYNNGEVKGQYNFVNDKLNGYYKEFYINGSLEEEGYYCDGKRCGEQIKYYKNGKMYSRRFWDKGEEINFGENFDINGRLERRLYYSDIITTREEFYDTLGKVYETYDYKPGVNAVTLKHVDKSKYVDFTDAYGKKHLKATYFYPNGKIQEEQGLFYGNYHGNVKQYRISGKLKNVQTYSMGLQTGKELWYDGDRLDIEENYNEDKAHGKKIWFGDYGKPEISKNYFEGLQDSVTSYYGEDGSLGLNLYYSDGYLYGYSYLEKNGQLKPIIPIKNETVKIVAYYQNGNKSREAEYKNGLLSGKRISYFTNGKVSLEGTFVNDLNDGKHTEYYLNGKVKSETTYKNGMIEGVEKTYYDTGILKSESNFINNVKYGIEKTFDKTGKLEKKYFYINGIPFEK